MHQAPAVHWQVPRMQVQALVLLAAALAGAGVHVLWWLQSGQTDARPHVWGFAVLLGSAAASLAGWAFTAPGRLDWNGNTWTWSTDGQAPCTGDLAIALDVQRLMVLRFDGAAQGVRWLWVGHAGSDAPWRAFRRAVVSSQQQGVGHHDASAGRQPMDAPPP